MSSLPPVGTPIVVTSTSKSRVDKFFGVYSNEDDQFVLRPFPGSVVVSMLWGQKLVDYDDSVVFPIRNDPFTWTLLEDDPLMRVDPSNEEEILEDIINANLNPSSLYTLKHWKNPRVILSAIREGPYMLEGMRPSNGLTPEILKKLLENGERLEYLPSDPILYETIIEHDPSYITQIPFDMLTDELIRTVFTENPNILHLDTMSPELKTRIQSQIQEYEDAPIPPSLERRMSATHSNQGNQGVCGRHAFSRVIVKNFFELILPLQSDRSREKDCNEFLLTSSLAEDDKLRRLTPQKCSFSGYIKILLFLHCFFLFQTHISTVEGRPEGWLDCVQVSELYKHLYTSIEIPTITHDQLYDLQDALYTVQTVQQKYNISLVTFQFKDITLDNIKKITEHGLYIMLRIEDSTNDKDFHSAHFVIIVGAFDDYMLVKNSWNKDNIYKIRFGYPFYLAHYTYDVLTDCSFVIPVQQPHNEEFGDLTHVDSYLQRYSELKTKFNGIVVNVINKSCPSKNKEPVECDAEYPLQIQASVFHPDKNPRCREEAESKFQQLITLKGCHEESPVQRLLIGNGKTHKSKRGKFPKRIKTIKKFKHWTVRRFPHA